MEFGLFLSFLGFFFTAVILVVAFLYLYALVTPYDDYTLIFEKNNIAAANANQTIPNIFLIESIVLIFYKIK